MKKYLVMGLLLVNSVPYADVKAIETTQIKEEPLYLVQEQEIINVREQLGIEQGEEQSLLNQVTTNKTVPQCTSNTDLDCTYLEKGLDNKDVKAINKLGEDGVVYEYYSPISTISQCMSTISDTGYYTMCNADKEYYFDNEEDYLEFEKQNTSILTPEQEQANQLFLENNTK